MPGRLFITLNARLRPLDRGGRYEDPLQAVLDTRAPGSRVTGGGTLLTPGREPVCCDIDLDIEGDGPTVLELVPTSSPTCWPSSRWHKAAGSSRSR